MSVLAANYWAHNGEMIADLHRLGYIKEDDLVCDMTYGKGIWWKMYRPPYLTANDIDPNCGSFHHDFRSPPKEWEGLYDVVAFDPPYVSVGGRETSTIPEFQSRYGMDTTPSAPRRLHDEVILPGLLGCWSITRSGGYILHKTQDYVSSGRLQPASHWAYQAGTILGMVLVDEFVFLTTPRPQPERNIDGSERRQVHARRNYSTLYVWGKR